MQHWDELKDYKFLLFHIIGLDGLGHYKSLHNEGTEKGVMHVETIVK